MKFVVGSVFIGLSVVIGLSVGLSAAVADAARRLLTLPISPMAKHTHKRNSQRPCANLRQDRLLRLEAMACQYGRVLKDVPHDNKCQFHALLDQWQQVDPQHAVRFNVDTLRTAIVDILSRPELLQRIWLDDGDSDGIIHYNFVRHAKCSCCATRERF